MINDGDAHITDVAEGQRGLDEADGEDVMLSAKQKRALETATMADESTNKATVVSSADGAKVQNNLEILADSYKNRPNKAKGFITDLSRSLGLEQHEASQYGTFVTENGKTVTIRVSNHNARVSFFDKNGENDGISIVISNHKNKGLLNDGNAHIIEFFYSKQSLQRADSKPLSDIIRSVSEALYSGEFKDTTGLAERQEVNAKQIREQRMGGADGLRFFRTANGEAYGFTVGGKIYVDPRIATSETPVHEYAHLWASALRNGNAEEWQNVVGLMKDSKVWDEVKGRYPELKTDDEIADEVIATYSGRRGAERLREEQRKIAEGNGGVFEKAEAISALEHVKRALKMFWKGVADFLHIHYKSAEEVADRVMKDLLEGVDPRKMGDGVDRQRYASLGVSRALGKEAAEGEPRYQFIGEKGAAEADHAEEVSVRLDNLSVAREMEAEKKDAKAIKMATGWERGADGKWRYEIADLKEFDRNGNLLYRKHHPDYARYIELQDKDLKNLLEDGEELTDKEREEYEALSKKYESDKFGGEKLDNIHTLEAYVDAPELFKAYPELRNVRVTFKDTGGWETASYYAISDAIDFNVDDVGEIVVNTGKVTANMRTKELKSVFLHEIQHAIQVIEGFAEGGSPQYMKGLYSDYFLQDYSSSQLHELAELRRIAEGKVKRGEYKRMSYAVKNVIKAAKEHGFYPTWAESFDNNPNSVTTVYDTLVKFPSEILDKAVLIDERDLYNRVAGEVEARNVQERMGMSAEERRASLAAETEDVAREDQIFLMGDGVSNQQTLRNVNNQSLFDAIHTLYSKGKAFASQLFNMKFFDVAETPDFMKRLGLTGDKFTVRYGVLSRHFGKDGSHDFTEAEWNNLPKALKNPFAIAKVSGKKNAYRIYTSLRTSKGEYVVVGVDVKNAGRNLEVNSIATIFGRRNSANLPINEELLYTSKEITPEQMSLLSQPNSDQYPSDQELSDANVDNSSETAKESEGKDRQRYASIGVSRSLGEEAAEGEPRWASWSLSEPRGEREQRAANERFNNELTRYQNGEMDKNEMLHLGRPQGVMRAFLPNLPIVMRQRILTKGSVKKHNVAVEALVDMPNHLSHPIFVFKRSDNVLGVLTEMQDRDGKNVCVAIELNRQIQNGGEILEVNDIRSVHGRNVADIVYPIVQNGTLKWVDKEKGLTYLSSASQYVRQEIDKQDLDTATKVVKDFVNPKESDGKDRQHYASLGVSRQFGDGERDGEREQQTANERLKGEGYQYMARDKFSLRLAEAKNNTDKNPSQAQKESGNYRKGHIRFGGYNYTIENPQGSYRSGVDENGKKWKQKMNNTYGYILGTKGKDGDHLDMFINDKADLDSWNGNVYVVDQVLPDGSFDEHKVMYGFDSEEEARKAYLSNYEQGWQGLGNITGVSKEDFDRWLEKSGRKTKAFSEYKNVKSESAESPKTGAFGTVYTQFRGKAQEAFDFLASHGSGDLLGVFHREGVGDIDAVWGDKGGGLDHIIRKHIGDGKSFHNIVEAANVIDDIIKTGSKAFENGDKIVFKKGSKLVTIRKNVRNKGKKIADKNWVLTAYDELSADGDVSAIAPVNQGQAARTTGKSQRKDTTKPSYSQKKNVKSNKKIPFSLKKDRTLAGVHNITEEKLLKAIKQGGLANPSVAVIDSSKQNHDDYGDISLILPSDKVAKRTGKNAGTWQGDAWTPTYPQVERQMSNKGAEKASNDVSSVPGDMYSEVRRGLDRWLDGGEENSAMAYMFLHEKGVAPEPKKIQPKFSDEAYNDLKSITAGNFNIYGIGKADARKVLDMYIDAKFDGDKDLYEEKTKAWLERNKSIVDAGANGGMRYAIAKENIELYDEYGFNYKGVQTFVRDVEYDHRKTGVDMNATLNEVEDYIKTNNLTDEFNTWMEGKEKEYGIKEVIFDGFTPSGNRRYVPNTLENVSKIMKKQGRNGSTGISVSFQNFAARLMPSYGTLKDIRSKKGLLTSDREKLDKFREKWSNVFFELGMKCQPDATGTFDDYGLARLSEAAMASDPQAYLKKEYNVDFSDEDTKRLKEMVKAIKEEYPAMYFETKFERPVGFDEFSSAVVPTTASNEVKQALQNAGVQIYEYDKEKEGDRSRAFNEAINSSDNIRFSLDKDKGTVASPSKPSKAEAVLRDAVIDRLRENGMDVITDVAEGQKVLDEANGDVREMSFGEPYDYEAYPLGRVEPNLADREVMVVRADADHGFMNYKEAKAWAKQHVAKVYNNEETGGKGDVRISNAAIDKFMSQSAVDKSDGKDVHMSVLKVLPEVLKNSIDVETHPDFLKGEDGKRRPENGMNKDVLVHRCYGAVSIDGKPYRVKITLKEEMRNKSLPHNTHSYEATKIELLAGTLVKPKGDNPNTNNSISAAKLLENVVMSYNPGEKVLDASEKRSAGLREQRVYHGSGADGVRFFRTANGEAYGFTVGGKIYVDPRIATSETPVHEYAHLWATALRSGNKEEWQNVVGLMKDSKVWDEVKKRYPELKTDDEIADEVIATYSGRRGAERLREEQRKIAEGDGGVFEKAEAISALESVKRALKMFWKGVADFLHIHYKSAEEVADRVMKDLLEGVDPRKMGETKDGGVRFNAKQKRALETASLGNAPRSLTVVSSATGAKILNSIDKLVESLEKSATQPKTFIGNVAKALGASRFGSGSEYATFETKNGDIVTIRLANHNAHVSGFDHNGKDNGISIVISPKPNEGITNDGNAHITEFYYDSIKLRRADGKPLAEIVRSIKQALYSGEFKDTTGLAERQEVNGEDVIRYQFIGEKGAAEADHAEEVSVRLDNLSVAREMEAEKKDAKAIKMATGWERGADGKWRYEIADGKLKDGWEKKAERVQGALLSEVMDNKELFAYYPQLKDVSISVEELDNDVYGRYNPYSKTIFVSNKIVIGADSVVFHEVQHAIQEIEGFAKGGSSMNVRRRIQRIIDAEQDASDYAKGKLKEWVNLKMAAERLDNLYEKYIHSDNAVLKGKAIDAYWDAMNEVDNHADSSLENVYPDGSARDIAESGYHVDEVKKELRRLSQEAYDAIPEGNMDALHLVRKLENALEYKSDEELYHSLGGEVEARNVEERMGMSAEERRASLAAETEDVAREDQIFLMGDGVSEMGSRVGKRMAEIGEHYEDRALTDEERPIVDVFCGRNDNLKVSIERDGKSLVLIMRQGSENGAGTKHCLYRHYGTGVGYRTADDVQKIPFVMANGTIKEKLRGKSRLVEYTYKDKHGCVYTLLTEKKKGFEIFNDFYTNRKASSLSTFNTSEDAHTGSDNALMGAKVGNVSETAKESEGKDRRRYASLGVSRSFGEEAGEGEPRWASLGLSEPRGKREQQAANERFNNELTRYQNGKMDKNEKLHLGRPQGTMRVFLPNLPIVMRQRVIKKGSEKKHEVDVSAIMNMPQHLSSPIFVFQRSEDTIGILTDMRDRNGKNVCVAIELKRQIQHGAKYLEVNDVRSFHGRDFKNIVEPIANNKTLKWVDKEKGLAYLSSASQPVQQEIDKQVLDTAANVVKDFVNPKESEEKDRQRYASLGVSMSLGEEAAEGEPHYASSSLSEPRGEEVVEGVDPRKMGETKDGVRNQQTLRNVNNQSLFDAIHTMYSKGKIFASQLFNMKFFDVAETPDFMKRLGLTGDKFTIRYGVISRYFGKDNQHDFTEEEWKQMPKALSNPILITEYYQDEQQKRQKGYRLYTPLKLADGSYVVVSAEVKNAGKNLEINAINTIFGRNAISDIHDRIVY